MKKVLFSLSLLASLATYASESTIDATAQVFGCLPVTTSAKSVIVSVPWIAAGTAENPISVSNIIKTAGLTANDEIRVWRNSDNKFYVWRLTAGTGGVLYWDKVTNITKEGASTGENADIVTLTRGDALVLVRADEPSAAYTFYVYGQYTATAASSVTCALGTTTAKAYTMIAPPGTTTTTLNAMSWTNVGKGDKIVFTDGNSVGYDSTQKKWGAYHDDGGDEWVWYDSTAVIAPGTGFWYVSGKGSKSAAPTVAW